jgi:hypothetical protein
MLPFRDAPRLLRAGWLNLRFLERGDADALDAAARWKIISQCDAAAQLGVAAALRV